MQRSGTWAPSLPLVTLLWQHDDITSPPLQRPHELSMGVMTQWVDFQLVSHYHVSAACQKPQYAINWGGVDVSLKGEERGNKAIVQERCSANCMQVRHRIRSTVCVLSIQCPPCVWKHGLLRHAKRNIFCLILCGFFVHSLCRWQQTVCFTSRCANIIEWAFQTVQPFKPFSIISLWWSLFSFCSIWSTNITIWDLCDVWLLLRRKLSFTLVFLNKENQGNPAEDYYYYHEGCWYMKVPLLNLKVNFLGGRSHSQCFKRNLNFSNVHVHKSIALSVHLLWGKYDQKQEKHNAFVHDWDCCAET